MRRDEVARCGGEGSAETLSIAPGIKRSFDAYSEATIDSSIIIDNTCIHLKNTGAMCLHEHEH